MGYNAYVVYLEVVVPAVYDCYRVRDQYIRNPG
jgi:hypothetical protein